MLPLLWLSLYLVLNVKLVLLSKVLDGDPLSLQSVLEKCTALRHLCALVHLPDFHHMCGLRLSIPIDE